MTLVTRVRTTRTVCHTTERTLDGGCLGSSLCENSNISTSVQSSTTQIALYSILSIRGAKTPQMASLFEFSHNRDRLQPIANVTVRP